MNQFIVLIALLFVIFLLGYVISDGDFFSPTCIASLGFIFSSICAAINSSYWGMELKHNTISVIIGALFLYLSVETFVKIAIYGKYKSTSKRFSSTYENLYLIKVSNYILIGMIGLTSVAVLLYLRQVIKIAKRHRASGTIGIMLNKYRQLSSFNVLDASDSFPGWLNLLYVAVIGMGLFWSYILINNYLVKRKIDQNIILNAILVILSVVMNMVNANRTRMIMLAISIMLYIWFFWHRIYGWKSGVKIGTLIKIMIAVVGFIFIFFGLRNAVGRNDTRSLLYVITHYFGAPIAGLNSFLQNPVKSTIWGKETFAGINNYIGNHFGLKELVYSTQKEFRNIRGINIGNVYTAFRSYIHDFGYMGMIILTAIESLFMSVIYYTNKKRVVKAPIDIKLLLLPLFYYANVLLFYADWFYEQINISIVRMIIILLIVSCIFNKITLKWDEYHLLQKKEVNIKYIK